MNTETIKLDSVIIDMAAGPFGSNLKVSCFVNYGFPIIDGANLKGFKVTDNITKYVTEEKARSLHRSMQIKQAFLLYHSLLKTLEILRLIFRI